MNLDYYANVPKSPMYLKIIETMGSTIMNANSAHCLAIDAKTYLQQSYDIMAKLFPQFKTVEFVPGGGSVANIRALTETLVVKYHAKPGHNDIIMISSIEHSSISKYVVMDLLNRGYTVIIYPVLKNGIINIAKFIELFEAHKDRIIMVSCMYTNNETGIIQPIFEMIDYVKTKSSSIIFHCDAGSHLDTFMSHINQPDIITASGYKYGGSHIGILLSNVKLRDVYYGTPNTLDIFATATIIKQHLDPDNLAHSQASNNTLKQLLVDKLFSALDLHNIPYIMIGPTQHNIIAFILPWFKASLIQSFLSKQRIAIGSGSACTTNEGSHTLKAMGFTQDVAQKLIRLSFNHTCLNSSDIDLFVTKFIESIEANKYLVLEGGKKYVYQCEKSELWIRPSARESALIDVNLDSELYVPTFSKIMVTYAELHLKGKNKKNFIEILKKDIRSRLKEYHLKYHFAESTGYIYIVFDRPMFSDVIEPIVNKMLLVAGISHIIPIMTKDIDKTSEQNSIQSICDFVGSAFNTKFVDLSTSFKIITSSDTKLPFGKRERDWDYYLGQYIRDRFHAIVDLSFPDVTISVNITSSTLNVATDKHVGMGGLPVGTEGEFGILITNANILRSIYSMIQMIKRGAIPHIFCLNVVDELVESMNNIISRFLSDHVCVTLTYSDDWFNTIFDKRKFDHIIIELGPLHLLKRIGKMKYQNVFANTMTLTDDEVNHSLNKFDDIGVRTNLVTIRKIETITDMSTLIDPLKTIVSFDQSLVPSTKGLMLISGGIDSPVASHKLLASGYTHDYIHFISSFDDVDSMTKINKIVKKLQTGSTLWKLQTDSTLWYVEFGKLQKEITKRVEEKYRVMMYKIYMVLIANHICKENDYSYISMGNSWGQVASQTPKNIFVTDAFSEVPILSPLLCLNKDEIIKYAHLCGTYEKSICNGNDCCVMFLPKHPILSAKVGYIKHAISEFGDWNAFVKIKTSLII